MAVVVNINHNMSASDNKCGDSKLRNFKLPRSRTFLRFSAGRKRNQIRVEVSLVDLSMGSLK